MDREKIRNKFGGHCAYCGGALGKRFHVDHVIPLRRSPVSKTVSNNWGEVPPEIKRLLDDRSERHKELDTEENMYPACPRCNLRKSVLSVEQFRQEIQCQNARLYRDSAAFRLAIDFHTVKVNKGEVRFYFEDYKQANPPKENHES